MFMIGIIAGSGVYDPSLVKEIKKEKVQTEFGLPSDEITVADFEGIKVAFLPRHGYKHTINPSNVNYRANIRALKKLGVDRILSVSAVGSLQKEIKPGCFVFVNQFIDRTYGRKNTFYDGITKGFERVCHINVSDAFCEELRKPLIAEAKKLKIEHFEKGTYVGIEGPRFSTRAESALYRSWNAQVIGMTLCPEASLAREAEICYANISMATDYDNLSESGANVEDIIKTMKSNTENVRKLLYATLPKIQEERKCICRNALQGAFI
ncbi:MAG: S-methyl-5'-thioadenosine phosphorylase [archaeon]